MLRLLTGVALLTVLAGGLLVAAGLLYLLPGLPSIEHLRDVRLQVPLRVYTADHQLIAEFGEKRRQPVAIGAVPKPMVEAFIAAEDDRFYQHPGVDWQGLVRAAIELARTGTKRQGGSTITMQVARNFFLGREKTYLRKLNEILLALKIEQALSKDEILELYLNKIYLGQRAYGVAAAARVYYGLPLEHLTLAQIATIAGLPKAPSRLNPVTSPERALARRNYVLGRMHELGYIDDSAFQAAVAAPITASLHTPAPAVPAPYVAEMVRTAVVERFGERAYTAGLVVRTTVDGRLQGAAREAVRAGLIAYDRRHGYRGAEARVALPTAGGPRLWSQLLEPRRTIAGLAPALVVAVRDDGFDAFLPGVGRVTVPRSGFAWARRHLGTNRRGPRPKAASEVVEPGDVIRLRQVPTEPSTATADEAAPPEYHWELAQLPQVEGALVALDPADGALRALVGGFDFASSKFNRAVQARRQPGSNFKPFIYSAALEAGYTAATLVNDAPIVFDAPGLEGAWRPENYSGRYRGPTRLRVALAKSRNLVSIRVLRAIGVDFALDHVARFGFDRERLPHNLSLALGSGELSPLEVARGFAVFASGGHLVDPYLVDEVLDQQGQRVWAAPRRRVCRPCDAAAGAAPGGALAAAPSQAAASDAPEPAGDVEQVATEAVAPQVIDPRNAWIVASMLGDVIRYGTGQRARSLGRSDLAGKTGTTNEQKDAWFSGFNARLVATAWVGFDQVRPLGRRETGARAALPIWIDFMQVALEGAPPAPVPRPDGLVTVRIDPATGALARAGQPGAIFETFRPEYLPKAVATASSSAGTATSEQLF